jgi:hypothetical protein
VFGLVATLFTKSSPPLTGVVLFVVSAVVVIGVGQLRYHEVEELRAGVRRTVSHRRVRVANNVRVRRAGLALSKADNLNQVFDALRNMLEFEEFAYANVQLGQAGHGEAAEQAFIAIAQRRPLQEVEFNQGQITWSWKRDGVDPNDDVLGSSNYWCFRLPLATENGAWGWMNLYRPLDGPQLLLDMNYLSGFLRIELSQAAERVITSFEETTSASNVHLAMTAGKIAG